MMLLTAEERLEYEKLLGFYEMGFGESRELMAKARQNVAERKAQKKIATLRELAVSSLGVKEKVSAWILYRWVRRDGVEFLGQVIANFFARKGWQTSLVGVPILFLAGYVQFYCATDAKTGGWIDPHCAEYVKYALWLSPLGHFLAPGFTAKVGKE